MPDCELTKEQAAQLYDSGWWEGVDAESVARWQLEQPRLCMPWAEFQQATEKALGRPVWTHEFANHERLLLELDGEEATPDNPAQHAVATLAEMLGGTN